jgi:hypothetical protein
VCTRLEISLPCFLFSSSTWVLIYFAPGNIRRKKRTQTSCLYNGYMYEWRQLYASIINEYLMKISMSIINGNVITNFKIYLVKSIHMNVNRWSWFVWKTKLILKWINLS